MLMKNMKIYKICSLPKEKKEKKWQHGCEQYKNLLEVIKQKLVVYRKKI